MDVGGSAGDTGGLQEAIDQYRVFDQHYEELGKVEDVFVDASDQPTYISVKMGFLGTKSKLVPVDLVRVNDIRELVEVAESKEVIEDAPDYGDAEELTPEQEAEIRTYYRLSVRGQEGRERDRAQDIGPHTGPEVDLEYGERRDTFGETETAPPETKDETLQSEPRQDELRRSEERSQDKEAPRAGPEADEVRVQRTEEELRAGIREQEVGRVNVRKRVRTDREQVRVPKKREEVVVERVPVEQEPAPDEVEAKTVETESGEEEIRIPVVEEEVVVEKRPVVKEEIRLRKRVVEEEEVIEEDVRKEEIEVDETDYRDR